MESYCSASQGLNCDVRLNAEVQDDLIGSIKRRGVLIPERTYQPDQEKTRLLLENCSDELRGVYCKFLDNLQHVSFKEFVDKLAALLPAVENFGSYNVVFDGEHHSKAWVYFLIEGTIDNHPVKKVNVKDFLPDVNVFEHLETKKFVIFDDGAYSGSQLRVNILQIMLAAASQQYSDTLEFLLCVPYMTELARYDISKLETSCLRLNVRVRIRIAEPVSVMTTTRELLDENDIAILKREHEEFASDLFLNSTLTYFDHKIPDVQSFNAVVAGLFAGRVRSPYSE